MLDRTEPFRKFKCKVDVALEEFKKLTLANQIAAAELVRKCLDVMRNTIELNNTPSSTDMCAHEPVTTIYSDADDASSSVGQYERLDSLVKRLESDEDDEEQTDATSNGRKTTCHMCGERLSSRESLMDHVTRHPGTRVSCRGCRETFDNFVAYEYHRSGGKCGAVAKTSHIAKVTCCPICGTWFKKTYNFRRHLSKCGKVVKKEFSCRFCPRKFEVENLYQEHIIKHEIYRCKSCKEIFPCRRKLREHLTLYHSKKNYSCEICSLTFKNRLLFREHMKQFKDEDHIKIKRTIERNEVDCKLCSMTFCNESSYRKHCKSETHMKANNETISTFVKFICEKCGASFVRKSSLIDHIYNLHQRAIINCDQCPYSTRQSSNMNRHKNIFHIKAVKKFACDKCPLLFENSSALKVHIHCVHLVCERKFACNVCDKKFKLKSQLNKHKVTHEAGLSFACNHCCKRFNRKCQLQRHLAAKHEKIIPKTTSAEINKKSKAQLQELTVQPPPTIAQNITNIGDDRVFSCMDVQSGELVQLSNIEMLKNNVVNITTEGEILNYVHVPEFWQNQESELYMIQPNHDAAQPENSCMLPPSQIAYPQVVMMNPPPPPPQPRHQSIFNDYVPNYINLPQNDNTNLDMVAKSSVNQQNHVMDPQMIVEDPPYNDALPVSMPHYYNSNV